MHNKSNERRKRGAVGSLIGLVALALAVAVIWLFFLREGAPFAPHAKDSEVTLAPSTDPTPEATVEATDAPASEVEATAEAADEGTDQGGEADVVTPTPDRLPTPTLAPTATPGSP